MLCCYKRTSQNPLDDCKHMRHLVDTRSQHFGNKTVKMYQKLHYNTNQEKKNKISQRQQRLSRYR